MKKLFFLCFCAVLLVSIVSGDVQAGRRKSNLVDFVKKCGVCRVYIKEPVNSSESADAGEKELVEGLGTALKDRKSQSFVIVAQENQADMIIGMDIVSFLYSEDDPAYDGVIGVGMNPVNPVGLVADVLQSQNYIENTIEYNVMGKDGRSLWKKKIKSTVTKSEMPIEAAKGEIAVRSSRNFIMGCLSK